MEEQMEEMQKQMEKERKEREEEREELKAAAAARERELGTETTCGQLLDSRLSPFEDVSMNPSSTKAVGSRIPVSVTCRPISAQVDAYRKSLDHDFLNAKALKMSKSFVGPFRASEESFITSFFIETAGKSLNRLFEARGEPQ